MNEYMWHVKALQCETWNCNNSSYAGILNWPIFLPPLIEVASSQHRHACVYAGRRIFLSWTRQLPKPAPLQSKPITFPVSKVSYIEKPAVSMESEAAIWSVMYTKQWKMSLDTRQIRSGIPSYKLFQILCKGWPHDCLEINMAVIL